MVALIMPLQEKHHAVICGIYKLNEYDRVSPCEHRRCSLGLTKTTVFCFLTYFKQLKNCGATNIRMIKNSLLCVK